VEIEKIRNLFFNMIEIPQLTRGRESNHASN